MYTAIRGALTLALTLLVLQIFLPDVATGLVSLLARIIEIALAILNQVPTTVAQ
jgi:hypothetical protein